MHMLHHEAQMNYGCPHIDPETGACRRRGIPLCRPAEAGCVLHGKVALAVDPPPKRRRTRPSKPG